MLRWCQPQGHSTHLRKAHTLLHSLLPPCSDSYTPLVTTPGRRRQIACSATTPLESGGLHSTTPSGLHLSFAASHAASALQTCSPIHLRPSPACPQPTYAMTNCPNSPAFGTTKKEGEPRHPPSWCGSAHSRTAAILYCNLISNDHSHSMRHKTAGNDHRH